MDKEELNTNLLDQMYWDHILGGEEEIVFNFDYDIHEKRKRLRTCSSFNFSESKWGMLINDERVHDPDSRQGRLFRRRFRLPYQLFTHLVKVCKMHNILKMTDPVKQRIPIEFKILVALRILGRGTLADDVAEMSGIGTSTAYEIFHTFIENFCLLKDQYIQIPKENYLQKVLTPYEKLGATWMCWIHGLHSYQMG